MTSQRLKELFRKSSGTVRETAFMGLELPPLPPDRGLHISANHPEDGLGVLIQCELDAEDRRSTGKVFHCVHLTDKELRSFINKARKAMDYSRRLRIAGRMRAWLTARCVEGRRK